MPLIDPTTNLGKVRLRCGDFSDVPFLPDNVYEATLADTNNNVVRAAGICAQYILASLTKNTRSRLANIESFDQQQFEQYRRFILDTISNPSLMNISPIAFVTGDTDQPNPLIDFQKLWNAGYVYGTVNQEMQAWANRPVEPISNKA